MAALVAPHHLASPRQLAVLAGAYAQLGHAPPGLVDTLAGRLLGMREQWEAGGSTGGCGKGGGKGLAGIWRYIAPWLGYIAPWLGKTMTGRLCTRYSSSSSSSSKPEV